MERKCKDHNVNFISQKNTNTILHLSGDSLHPNRNGQYMTWNNFSTFINNLYFWKLIPTASTGVSVDCIPKSQNSNEIKKGVKSGKYHGTFSLLKKQRLHYPKNVICAHLNVNSPWNKFGSISELIKVKFNIFLINKTKLDASFLSNQFAMFGYKLVRKNLELFGDEIPFLLMINCQAGLWKFKILQTLRF